MQRDRLFVMGASRAIGASRCNGSARFLGNKLPPSRLQSRLETPPMPLGLGFPCFSVGILFELMVCVVV